MSEDCFGARFEILLDGKTQYCRDTMLTAMGAATFIKSQNPDSKVAVRDLQRTSEREPEPPPPKWLQPKRGSRYSLFRAGSRQRE